MNKIILKDKTTYEIAEGTGIGAVTITVDSYEALKPIEDAFLKEGNLEKVTFMIDDQINGEYTNLKLVSKTFEYLKLHQRRHKIMVNFYVDKIQNEVINEKTGNAWTLEDVPRLWRKKVEKALAK